LILIFIAKLFEYILKPLQEWCYMLKYWLKFGDKVLMNNNVNQIILVQFVVGRWQIRKRYQ